jgi:hypothetical protein
MGLYTNRLITQATVYNRACEISVRPIVPSQPTSDTIDEMVVNGDFADGIAEWQIEQQNGVKASAAVVPDGPNGQSAMRLDVEAVADEPWRLQLYQNKIAIQEGKSYTLTFWCKSNRSANFFHFNNQQSSLDNHQSDGKNAQRFRPEVGQYVSRTKHFAGSRDECRRCSRFFPRREEASAQAQATQGHRARVFAFGTKPLDSLGWRVDAAEARIVPGRPEGFIDRDG